MTKTSKESKPKTSSKKGYYEVINGINYDKKLIEHAVELMQGKGDGRISVKDVNELLKKSLNDGGCVTAIEMRTVFYLLNECNFTNQAKSVMIEAMSKADLWTEEVSNNNENKVINDILNEIICKIEQETSSGNSLTIKIPPETYENIELSENLVIRRNNPEITNQLTREMRTYYIHNPVVKLFVSSVFYIIYFILVISFIVVWHNSSVL